MCFYNGIDISRAQHIKLNKKEKKLSDSNINLHQPLASGFDYPLWPVIKPIENGDDFEIEMMHWNLFLPTLKLQTHFCILGEAASIQKQDKKIFLIIL